MIVLAQRWVEGTPAKSFGRQVVEALVVARDTPGDGPNWSLYSAFYDPAQDQTVATAFHWWHRGVQGLMPSSACLALDILSHWAIPADELTTIKQYVERMDGYYAQVKAALTAAAKEMGECTSSRS